MIKKANIKKLKAMSKGIDASYIQFARELAKVVEEDQPTSKELSDLCDTLGIGYRKGVYLLSIAKVIRPSMEALYMRVGWTKASCLASAGVIGTNAKEDRYWLKLAEQKTMAELNHLLRGSGDKVRTTVLFSLSSRDMVRLRRLLLEHGADIRHDRIFGRDQAFSRVLAAIAKGG